MDKIPPKISVKANPTSFEASASGYFGVAAVILILGMLMYWWS